MTTVEGKTELKNSIQNQKLNEIDAKNGCFQSRLLSRNPLYSVDFGF